MMAKMDNGEGFDQAAANPASGMRLQGVLMVITGGVGLAFGVMSVLANTEQLDALAGAWTAGGASKGPASVTAIKGAAAAGAVVLLAGFLGIASFCTKKRILAIVALLLVLISSAMQIAGAVLFSETLTVSEQSLIPQANSTGVAVEDRVYLEVGNAVYNVCCQPVWINSTNPEITNPPNYPGNSSLIPLFQQPIDDCALGYPPDGEGIQKAHIEAIKALLRSCYYPEVFNPIEEYVQSGDTCKILEGVDAKLGAELEIPTTTYTVIAALRLAGILPDDYVIPDWAMVGFPAEYAPDGSLGFNCGIMHAKAIAWIQHLWMDDQIGDFVIVCYALGSVQLLSIVFVVIYWVIGGGGSDHDEWMDYETSVVSPRGQRVRNIDDKI
ncbi:Hypothetical Protein FCC1311_024002 [Hondaea fermentalgiana]|uniref:Uncharacterized protein n=1 Tax=Hondaea fermentalgiana TaxID=2315210 RepID=A0A2R5G775_9STRA|nr:Hypothetical Protein FCC1311_024002 [Hondaea fermentalgiana]|eukprot:GBG26179.1 Hypothetical Protein FCC1311_024002 [Hondaea fermentalgiana]